jgi:hypothetical protein
MVQVYHPNHNTRKGLAKTRAGCHDFSKRRKIAAHVFLISHYKTKLAVAVVMSMLFAAVFCVAIPRKNVLSSSSPRPSGSKYLNKQC